MIDAKELRRVLGHFATGVTIVTTHDGNGNPFGLTANAFTSVSLDPPLVLVCVDRRSESFPHFHAAKAFAVNILSADQQALSNAFAKSGGDKFAGVTHRRGPTGCALLEGAIATLDCRIVATHDAGDHEIHVGQVEAMEAPGGDPLLYVAGQYRRVAQH